MFGVGPFFIYLAKGLTCLVLVLFCLSGDLF
jgi:hypothetical protein